MDKYYLFRGDTLVKKKVTWDVLGAGDLHSHGKEGDVLIITAEQGDMLLFNWVSAAKGYITLPWVKQYPSFEELQRYRVLLLIQQ